jgi:ankyrin repeat protein
MAELLLQNGANVNAAGVNNKTPLFIAAEKGYKTIAELLLKHKAELNPQSIQYPSSITGVTPLHIAVINNFKAMAELLVANGANINAQSHLHASQRRYTRLGTPLHYAVDLGNESMIAFLLSNKADVNAVNDFGVTPLIVSIRNNDLARAELLIKHNANVNVQVHHDIDNLRDESGNSSMSIMGHSPLHFAMDKHNKAMVELLLKNKADPNKQNSAGETPLLMAAKENKDKDIVELLLAYGADVNYQGPESQSFQTPLHAAINAWAVDNVKMILSKKANLEIRNKEGYTPMQLAVAALRMELLEPLLKAGANPNVTYLNGETLLHVSVRSNGTNQIALLLAHGANVDANNQDQLTPLADAVMRQNTKICVILLKAGANPNVTVPDYRMAQILQRIESPQDQKPYNRISLLHQAVYKRNKDMINLLLDYGANINAMNWERNTPIGMALKYLNSRETILWQDNASTPPPPPVSARPISMAPGQAGPSLPAISPPPVAYASFTVRPQDYKEIVELLRKRGADETAERYNYITVSRPTLGADYPVHFRGTNAYNRFSLIDLVSKESIYFADLTRISINRLTTNGATKVFKVNLEEIINAEDRGQDVLLEWGDIVEVAVKDHLVDEKWLNYPNEILEKLGRWQIRRVDCIIKGQTNKVWLSPRLHPTQTSSLIESIGKQFANIGVTNISTISENPKVIRLELRGAQGATTLPIVRNYQLNWALRNAGILLASSDLTRVTVKRIDPITKQPLEMVFDINEARPETDLWLRDGDMIIVPDKPLPSARKSS